MEQAGQVKRIDSHQHFWQYNAAEYGWIGEGMEVLARDYLPAELAGHLERQGIGGSIAVQARQREEETAWLLELAAANDFIRGVVGWVDLCSESVEADLERWASQATLCGIRHILHDEPDDRYMLREDFLRGVGKLKQFGLTYDILIFPRHLDYTYEFVEQFEGQAFVVDHLAKPLIKDGVVEPWREGMRRLAGFERVYCKLSGMVTEASWQGWKPGDFRVYMETVLELFGADRLMFGSDWPVCTLAAEYDEVAGLVKDFIGTLSQSEQGAIMGQTAARFYLGEKG